MVIMFKPQLSLYIEGKYLCMLRVHYSTDHLGDTREGWIRKTVCILRKWQVFLLRCVFKANKNSKFTSIDQLCLRIICTKRIILNSLISTHLNCKRRHTFDPHSAHKFPEIHGLERLVKYIAPLQK